MPQMPDLHERLGCQKNENVLPLVGGTAVRCRADREPDCPLQQRLSGGNRATHAPVAAGSCSGPGGVGQDLGEDVKAGGQLPGEEADVDDVGSDVQGAGIVVALGHGGHEGGCQRPEHDNGGAGVQVGACATGSLSSRVWGFGFMGVGVGVP